MLRLTMMLAGALFLGLLALLTVFVHGLRAKSPQILDAIRRVNRTVFNPMQMRSAGTPGAYAAVIRHRGRTTGRAYETPLVPAATDDGFVIALPYGLRSDWMKNVLASGSATIVQGGHSYQVDQPEIITVAEGNRYFPARQQRTHSRFGVENCLRVRRVGPLDEGWSADAIEESRKSGSSQHREAHPG
jgi:deazaflavin-dependent oxidoreductase (nitroreductase family)